MNFMGIKVGLWPYGPDMDKAGDRRRFGFYAKERNIDFEIASIDKEYDIIYLTMGCNISDWLTYKKRYPDAKLVFEIVDSCFLQDLNFFTRSRGIIRWMAGKESKFYLNYQSAITSMLKSADAIVCSSATQKDFIVQYNDNVHISLDYFLNDITHKKTSFTTQKKLKLVWEGQAYTVNNLVGLKDVLKKLEDKIELHVITDPDLVFPFKIFNKKTSSILSHIQCKYHFYPWEKESFSKIISEMDLAIIPIDSHNALHWHKPENKLLLFWQIGIPVLTSNTPAYTQAINKAGLPFLCSSSQDWIQKIEEYIEMKENQRAKYAAKANDYIQNNHTKEIILQKWDKIFSSLY